MTPVRYGIIGLGQIARNGHIPVLKDVEGGRIAALSDVSAEALESAAVDLGDIATYENYHDLLVDPNVDVVVVATPNWLHSEQAIAAFEAGKHVFCEKPLGIDMAECEAILAAQRKSGRLLQVGHELRYSGLLQAAREKIDAGLIGAVKMMVFSEFRKPLLPGWRQTGKTGGVMLEKNSHFFDLFNWFADAEPERVIGVGGNNATAGSPLIDNCVVTVEYANQVRASLFMCLFSEYGSGQTLDIVGNCGRLIAYLDEERLVHYTRTDGEPQEWTFKAETEGLMHLGFSEEHRAFISALRNGESVLVDGGAARQTMRVALAAERAVAGETVVDV